MMCCPVICLYLDNTIAESKAKTKTAFQTTLVLNSNSNFNSIEMEAILGINYNGTVYGT